MRTDLASTTLPHSILPGSIVVVDAALPDYRSLVNDLALRHEVIVLYPHQDGIAHLAQTLAHRAVSALHLLCHGAPGCLFLGNTRLDSHTLKRYARLVRRWLGLREPQDSSPALLLYGCQVGEGEVGSAFVEQVHEITGANVAAASRVVGAGHWELDVRVGSVAAAVAVSESMQQQYSGQLMPPVPSLTEDPVSGTLPQVGFGAVAWRDFDRDGLVDFVITGSTTSNFSTLTSSHLISKIYRNTGSGFEEVTSVALPGVYDSAVAWGDGDGDGQVDLLITGRTTTGNISKLYRNTGSGFEEVTSLTLPGVTLGAVAWGDYDGDGRSDFILTGTGGTGIGNISRLYRNTANGFVRDTRVSLPGVSRSAVAWGDYDGDGRLDLLLTGLRTTDNRISKLYRNTGTGFAENTSITLPGVSHGSVAWGDYNGDGKLDFILTGDGGGAGFVSKLYRNTVGGFEEDTTTILPGVKEGSATWQDYDSDGRLDLLLTGQSANGFIARLYRNTGEGFTEDSSITLPRVNNSSVAWGYYTNDSKPDLLFTGWTGGRNVPPITKLYRNTTPESIAPTTTSDFNRDGKADILWRHPNQVQTRLFTMNGGEIVSHAQSLNIATAFQPTVADFNGDGKSDILWHNPTTGANRLFLMDGSTAYVNSKLVTMPTSFRMAGTGDFNGDGKSDILWRGSDGSNRVFLMNGTTVSNLKLLAAPINWQVQAIADFDGDNKDDVLWRDASTGQNRVFLMNGSTVKTNAKLLAMESGYTVAAVADFSGDGKADILWRNASTGANRVFVVDGTAATSTPMLSIGVSFEVAGTGDFNGDGTADVLWYDETTGAARVFVMARGSVAADGNAAIASPGTGYRAVVADYNGDGKDDVLWYNGTSDLNRLYEMNGTQVVNNTRIISPGADWLPIAPAGAISAAM